MCASNEPDNNRETRQEPNKRSTRRSNFFRIKQPPRQTTRKRETRLTSHSVEIVIDMLPIIIPTYMPTLGRIGGGLVVVSCVARGAQTRAKRPSGAGAVLVGRCGRISALRRLQPHHRRMGQLFSKVWLREPWRTGRSGSISSLRYERPGFCLKADWRKSARSSVSEGY